MDECKYLLRNMKRPIFRNTNRCADVSIQYNLYNIFF